MSIGSVILIVILILLVGIVVRNVRIVPQQHEYVI